VISVARCPRKKNRERLTRISSLAAIGAACLGVGLLPGNQNSDAQLKEKFGVYHVSLFHLDKTGPFRITNRSAVCQIDSE
jgi:hypothetical protein